MTSTKLRPFRLSLKVIKQQISEWPAVSAIKFMFEIISFHLSLEILWVNHAGFSQNGACLLPPLNPLSDKAR